MADQMQQLEAQLAAAATEQDVINTLNALVLEIKPPGQTYSSPSETEGMLFFLQQALSLSTRIESKPALYRCHQLLAEIYEKQGDRVHALAHFKQLHQLYKEIELEKEGAERSLAEAEAQHHAAELMALVEVSQEISATLDLPTVLERIASRIHKLLRATDTVVYLLQPDKGILQAVTAVGDYADEMRLSTLTLGYGIIGCVAQNGVGEIINKPSLDTRRSHIAGSWDKELGSDDDLFPMLVAPIALRKRVMGVIAIWRHIAAGLFTPANLNFLEALAQQAAIAIENVYLFEAEQHQRQLAEQHSWELETVNASLQATNADLDAFARMVAHDLKNPLGLLISYGDLLVDYGLQTPPHELQLIFQELYRAGQKAFNIVEELLLLARVRHKDSVRLEPLNMAQIVEEAQRRLTFIIADHRAEIIHPVSWPVAVGYAPWVEEIWANYLSNGLKYGGNPPYLHLGATPEENGMIRFWVRDNGPGLPAEAQAQLFAEFTRLNEVRAQGHGLGLSIVRRIVDRLGGQVGVESDNASGQGCTFYFTLPADS